MNRYKSRKPGGFGASGSNAEQGVNESALAEYIAFSQPAYGCAGLRPGRGGHELHGRKARYPSWRCDNPDAMKTALYFDPVNFASRIKAPVMAGIGFIDTISPPPGIWTALNQIARDTEPLPIIESEHDNLTPQKGRACPARTREILDVLVNGGEYCPNAIRKMNNEGDPR